MTGKNLKELGFEIDAEQKRATYWLNSDKNLSIVINKDKEIFLSISSILINVNAEGDKVKTVKQLIDLLKDCELDYPF